MRLAGKLFATAIVLLLLCLTILLALLHTRYATSVVTYAVNTFTPYTFTASHIHYDITEPWHLTIQNPSIQQPNAPFTARQLQVWLTPSRLLQPGWYFDTILVDGLNLDHDTPPPAFPHLHANRLALTDFNFQSPELTLKNSRLQFDNWRSTPSSQMPFTGDFQLAAETVSWQDAAIDNVLLDGNYTQQLWTIYGFSFNWQQASFNGQAEYLNTTAENDRLILHQLTITGLKLQNSNSVSTLLPRLDLTVTLPSSIDILRMDILDSNLELPELTLNHGNLSLQNWHWPATHWQQQNALVSLSADSLRWHDTVLDTPLAELAFSPQQIMLKGISAKVMEGYVQADGTLTPDTLALNQLTINSIKWFLPEQWPALLQIASRHFDNIHLATLDIGYAQLVDTNPERHFQLSGINASGHDLILKRHGHPGLWQGELTASAGFASFKTIAMVEPLITMHSQGGQWQLTELTVPFHNGGLLEAKGSVALQQEGKPWQLHLITDSMPATVLPQWLKLPLPISGVMDVDLSATGLSQHATALAYSLEGKLDGKFRQLRLDKQSPEQLWAKWSEEDAGALTVPKETATPHITASELHIRADRGRISLEPVSLQAAELSATLKGSWDLADPSGQQIELQATQGCRQLSKKWQGHQQQISQSSSCDGNNI